MKASTTLIQNILSSDKNRICGIYTITNRVNGKSYVGSSIDCARRIRNHRGDLVRNKHPSRHLQNAWNVYGAEAFEFRVVELVEDVNFLLAREQFWIWRLGTHHDGRGYNILEVPDRPSAGWTHSPETRARLSYTTKKAIAEGRINVRGRGRVWTPERRAKQMERFRNHTPEERAKNWAARSAAQRGRKKSEEWKRKVALARKDFRLSEASKAKISVSVSQVWKRPEFRARVSAALRGRKMSEHQLAAHRQYMRSFWQGMSEEDRAKRSEQIRAGWARRKAILSGGAPS